jgi:hypothetical protein
VGRLSAVGALALVGFVVAACGGGGGDGGDELEARCESYCNGLRTAMSGCSGDVSACPSDCAVWIKDSSDAGCPGAFDAVLSCTDGAPDVCQAVGDVCQEPWHEWATCIEACGVPGDVLFDPPCTQAMPCKSGTKLTMRSDVALACDVRVTLTCGGGTPEGTIPAGDPKTASGSIDLTCTGLAECGLRVDAANRYLSGSSTVYCTP